jgi:hypothetical protein
LDLGTDGPCKEPLPRRCTEWPYAAEPGWRTHLGLAKGTAGAIRAALSKDRRPDPRPWKVEMALLLGGDGS